MSNEPLIHTSQVECVVTSGQAPSNLPNFNILSKASNDRLYFIHTIHMIIWYSWVWPMWIQSFATKLGPVNILSSKCFVRHGLHPTLHDTVVYSSPSPTTLWIGLHHMHHKHHHSLCWHCSPNHSSFLRLDIRANRTVWNFNKASKRLLYCNKAEKATQIWRE